ncbi:MurR/RpiR family transcriptional regulator [Streptomyces sp. SBT349]|uniref:MurR/RpiR family transcriptional regulator n=1 Tax=Streptomyces sp. SBT349 TaxID=1580539 RepID=UPI00066C7037|nr:MurR/RpiR family transcriptional regulator [Streptomyces sp. SBT349]
MAGVDSTQLGADVTGATRNQGIVELRARIRGHWDSASPAERSVCRFLAEITPERLLYMSAAELGAETRTSNASVIRTLQRLGYSGLAGLKGTVAGPFTSEIAPEVRARRRIESTGGDLQTVWDRVTTESVDRIELLRRSFSVERFAQAVDLLLNAREITSFGFGASFVVAEHLALKLRRMGRRSRAIHSSGFRLADDLLSIERGDVVVAFAPARLLTEVEVLLDRARTVGATTILISDQLVGRLDESVTVILYAPNTPTGMTGEPLTTMVVADALAQGVAASDAERAVEASHTLTTVRQQLGF